MSEIKTNTIDEIQALTEAQAASLALETLDIKGHTVYLADLGGYFGYSCLVFRCGRHICYANDYSLHHRNMSRELLRDWYRKRLSLILFTDEEIGEPLKDYDELRRKEQYLHNYYGLQADHLSIFGNFSTKQAAEEHERQKRNFPYYNSVAFAYYADKEFVKHHMELYDSLMAAKDALKDDFEFQKSAFKYEMGNHEYHINWQGDYDTLGVFGNIQWHGDGEDALDKYFDELEFTDVQRAAYLAARHEYLKEVDY